MPDLQEIIRSLTGAWLLAKRDTAGYRYFNKTAEGFWRSFAAILFIAPVYFVFASFDVASQSGEPAADAVAPDAIGFYLGRTALLVVGWISFPLIMVIVSRILEVSRHYATYIIAFNWSSVLVEAILIAPAAMYVMGLIGAAPAGWLGWICLMLVVFYRWFIAKTALETTGLVASALVLLEFTLSIAISHYGGQLFA